MSGRHPGRLLGRAVGRAAPRVPARLEAGPREDCGHTQAGTLALRPPPVPGVGRGGLRGAAPADPLSPALCAAGEATWSGSEFEVSFPDSPGAQAQPDHLPQLTLPDSLTAAASPEDGLSAELLEAQAEEEPEEPASVPSPDFGDFGAEGAAARAPPPTPK